MLILERKSTKNVNKKVLLHIIDEVFLFCFFFAAQTDGNKLIRSLK